MTCYVVDAHTIIWFLEGNAKLGPAARSALLDLQSSLYLPATALA